MNEEKYENPGDATSVIQTRIRGSAHTFAVKFPYFFGTPPFGKERLSEDAVFAGLERRGLLASFVERLCDIDNSYVAAIRANDDDLRARITDAANMEVRSATVTMPEKVMAFTGILRMYVEHLIDIDIQGHNIPK